MQRQTPLLHLAFIASVFCLSMASCMSESDRRIWTEDGQIQTSDGPHFVKGVCYHPVAIGNDKRTFESLTQDLSLMKEMGINTIRVYKPIVSKAVLDEISEAGISVIISFGYDQDGVFDLKSGSYLNYIQSFKSHPAILLWELGNEYNYHPEWFGGSLDVWYETLREAATAIHAEDPNHPVSTAHGEVPDAELLQSLECIDLWGLNVYRWDESHTALVDFAKRSDKPVYFSELGADSYMAVGQLGYEQGENQQAQADATQNLLKHILTDSTRVAGVAVFSFTDGWWKAGEPGQQDVGGWAPGSSGVPYDATANEEYWGLVDINREKKEAFWVVKSFYESSVEAK